ncbi:MAG: hypothetical protein CVV42_08890 [Candidatus Riflebacteria bacterium HGW-Riflebacteria-2]|jgi:type II secretory pathway component HofQ|nr:MAG: hypothetical protein CVV42_08890 [Candidatus Riflebacteria bacterium HGW-Riflebacteria-2]
MKKIALALIFICFGIGMLFAEPEKNFIKVGGALEMRENKAGIAISTSMPGYTGNSEIAGLELGEGDHSISMSFKNMDAREIIRILGRTAKFNIVTCRSVTGKIEQVNMKDVEWPVALASLADSMGYQTCLQDGIIFVGTAADFKLLSAPVSGAPASEDKISMSFKSAALTNVLQMAVSIRKNSSIIMAASVIGSFSLSLTDVSEAVAVKAIARAAGYDCMYNDGVWFVTSPAVISSLRAKELSVPAVATGNNISLDFRNTDIRTIFSILARKGNLNIDLAENVQGRVSVKIVDQPNTKVAAFLAWCNGYEVTAATDGIQIK